MNAVNALSNVACRLAAMFQKLFVPVIPHTTWGNDQAVSAIVPRALGAM